MRSRAGAWRMGVLVFAALAAASAVSAAVTVSAQPRPDAGEPWAETSSGFVVPNDPLLREQWWLFNFGQEIGGRVHGEAGADIRAPEAWAVTQGSPDVVVAILDFGIDYDHPEFDGQIWTNQGETGNGRETNGIDDDGNGYVDDWRGWDFVDSDNDPLDEDGHGTHVAGVIAAKGGDGAGITGVAPGSRVMALRVGGPRGVDLASATPAAIEYAAAMGARIVVQSYTTDPSGLFDQSDAETAAMLAHPEILFVTGAGNDGNDYRDFAGRGGALKPCNNPTVPNLICVAGTDRADEAWEESTFGAGRVQIAAPAESMLVVARPKDVVFDDGFDDQAAWAPAADMQGFWAPAGPAPEFAFEADDTATDGTVLHITHRPPEGTDSVGVLRLGERVDLTGRTGCHARFSLAGTLAGSSTVSVGLFRESDQRRNAFGGERPVVSAEMNDAGGAFVPFSFPVDAQEPIEVAIRVETRGFGDEIDVRIDGVQIVCWKAEHGDRDYEYWAGTSFATPIVAGVAALVASAEPGLDPLQIRQAVLESAVTLPSLDGLVETGGRVDAFGALQRAAELAGGRAPAPSPTGDASSPRDGASTGEGVSFGSHDDYEMPEESQPIPAGRDGEDPAAPDDSDESDPADEEALPGDGGEPDDASSDDNWRVAVPFGFFGVAAGTALARRALKGRVEYDVEPMPMLGRTADELRAMSDGEFQALQHYENYGHPPEPERGQFASQEEYESALYDWNLSKHYYMQRLMAESDRRWIAEADRLGREKEWREFQEGVAKAAADAASAVGSAVVNTVKGAVVVGSAIGLGVGGAFVGFWIGGIVTFGHPAGFIGGAVVGGIGGAIWGGAGATKVLWP